MREEEQIKDMIENFLENQKERNNPRGISLTSNTPFSSEDLYAAIETLLSGHLTQGDKVREFEEDFADYIGVENAIMTNSGSSANLIALKALTSPNFSKSINNGEVITPAVTWSTTVFPIKQANLTPFLVDVYLGKYTIDCNLIEESVNEDSQVIMPVHLLGNPCNMDRITDIADRNDLFVIEDCCEAPGAEWDSKKVGSIGDIGTFSFYFSHHITTIEGGMLVTDNDEIAEIVRSLRAYGGIKDRMDEEKVTKKYPQLDNKFLFITEGYNLRSTEINASLGISQLKKLDKFIEKRKKIARYWDRELENRFGEDIVLPQQESNSKNSWFAYPILLRDKNKRSVTSVLEENWIETRPIVAGNMAEQPAINQIDHKKTSLKNSRKIMRDGFYVGLHKDIENPELLVKALKKAFN